MEPKALCCIIGSLLINLTLGSFYSLGNIVGYIASYMRNHGSPEVTVEQGIWFTGAFLFGQGSFIFVGSFLERNYNSRVACIFGCFIHCLSNYLSVWAINQSFLTLVIVFGLGSGIGCGSAYVAAIIAAQKWFPQNKGFFTGLIVAGFGAGGLISTMLQTAYVNPDNLKPNESGYFTQEEVYERVPNLFLYTAIIFTIVQGIGCILAFPAPPTSSPAQQAKSTEQQAANIVDESTLPDMRSVSSAFKYRIFYVIGFMMMLVCPGVSFIVTMGKAFGQVFIDDDKFLARMLAFAAVANALGRLTWGSLADKFSFSVCYTAKVSLFTILIVTFPFEFVLSSKAMYSVWLLGLFFGFSGTFVLFPVFIEQVFGAKFHGTVYGLLYLLLASSSLLTSLVIQMTLAPSSGQEEASSTEKLSTRFVPCAIIGALYMISLLTYLFAIPVRRVENAMMRRKEIEVMKSRNSLFNRADLFPAQRKTLAEKTIGSGGLRRENSLGSIVRFSDQPGANQIGPSPIKATVV